MTHGTTLRITLTGAILALVAMAPVAQAKQSSADVNVCNQATHTSVGGVLDADMTDAGSAAKYQTGLKAKSGKGGGLVVAAARSSALTLCAAPGDETTDDDGGNDSPPDTSIVS